MIYATIRNLKSQTLNSFTEVITLILQAQVDELPRDGTSDSGLAKSMGQRVIQRPKRASVDSRKVRFARVRPPKFGSKLEAGVASTS